MSTLPKARTYNQNHVKELRPIVKWSIPRHKPDQTPRSHG